MSKAAYFGVNLLARKVKNIYIGIDGIARKVKKGYIGIGGMAKQFYSSGFKTGLYLVLRDARNSGNTYISEINTALMSIINWIAVPVPVYGTRVSSQEGTIAYYTAEGMKRLSPETGAIIGSIPGNLFDKYPYGFSKIGSTVVDTSYTNKSYTGSVIDLYTGLKVGSLSGYFQMPSAHSGRAIGGSGVNLETVFGSYDGDDTYYADYINVQTSVTTKSRYVSSASDRYANLNDYDYEFANSQYFYKKDKETNKTISTGTISMPTGVYYFSLGPVTI